MVFGGIHTLFEFLIVGMRGIVRKVKIVGLGKSGALIFTLCC
jgi:hypothetical protein